MAAGITSWYDRSGGETAELFKSQWPDQGPAGPPGSYNTSAATVGAGTRCNANQAYDPVSKPAGTSKRQGAFYEKTGVLQHRTEPGFRDTKGACQLTEVPIAGYGTLRAHSATTRLPSAGAMVLGGPHPRRMERDDDTMSRCSRSSAASSAARSQARSQAGSQARSLGGGSRQSQASSVPSWVRKTAAESRGNEWNFDPLPMYERSNESYGKSHPQGRPVRNRPAGKTESGFLDPEELIRTLTRPDP